jgi:hypothetical protein
MNHPFRLFARVVLALSALLFALTAQAAFTDNGDGTVTDTVTGLMWDKCSWGQNNDATCTGAASTYNWSQALGVAVSANNANRKGHADWRLPNKNELESLADLSVSSPAINTTAFPNTVSNWYWTSTTYAPYPANAWLVYFDDGYTDAGYKSYGYYVRLVRSGQLFDSFDSQKASQTITFANPGAQVMGASPTLTATASSSLTPTFTSSTSGVCTITSGGALTLVMTGTCTIAADQAGDASYNAAPPVTQSFEVVIDGVCGSDDGQTLTSAPANTLCTAGSASGITTGNTSYDWSCTGSNNGGSNASCSATRNYVVTSSVTGGNGTISASQNVAYNATPSFTLTPNSGYVGSVAGTCGGNLSGNTYTTNVVTADCTVVASFPTYTGNTPTGTGTATATLSGNGGANCGFTSAGFVQPGSTPAGVTFPQGLFNFTLSNCTQGNSITMTVTYPSAVPVGAQYWKYGPTASNHSNHWYTIPATINGNSMTFSITDGGLGDDDYTANGTIADAGGMGVQTVQVAPTAIPTLSEWGMLLLAGMLGVFGVGVVRRQPE